MFESASKAKSETKHVWLVKLERQINRKKKLRPIVFVIGIYFTLDGEFCAKNEEKALKTTGLHVWICCY